MKIFISCNKVFVKLVCLWAEHRVSMYYLSTSSRGSGGDDGQRAMVSLWSSSSMQCRPSADWPSPVWTLWPIFI